MAGRQSIRAILRCLGAATLTASSWSAAHAASPSLERADGSALIYHLDRLKPGKPQGAILMLQGSGCDPVNERPWVRTEPPVLAPDRTVVTIEKYGVPAPASSASIDDCSPQFWAKNTLQQRVVDALTVIASLRAEPWWNGDLVIYGGSEGGAVAAMLAPLVPETKAVVIFSAGIGLPVADLIRSAVPPPMAAKVTEAVREARINPTGSKRFAGASYAWWADAADVTPAKALLQTNVPVLLFHGTKDTSAPVDTARATRDLLAKAGKRNLTYREYEGYDHFMKDAAGVDRKDEVLKDVAAWIAMVTRR